MSTVLDHIVVVTPDLAAGARFVEDALGVAPQQGGAHPRMGTHNCLLRIGDSIYLEVIAPDPAALRPEHPRWFDLDRLAPDAPPRLAAWVVRAADIHAASAHCASIVGEVQPMSRGDLSWLITVTPDGALPLEGAAPALIEWRVGAHPASALQDVGCSLAGLDIFHPRPERVRDLFAEIGLESPPQVRQAAEPGLAAHIQTPDGQRTLGG